jgi:hypothetical protein
MVVHFDWKQEGTVDQVMVVHFDWKQEDTVDQVMEESKMPVKQECMSV